eukprot:gb/GECH01011010.1/.p1 GENE.gb/GECH01011010.1/~~gb/GECH01011010.1/.p1  ORF type:complete len:185 (+),score=10.84 gb/GECH01011010.1/:1-555(+)
MSQDKIFTSIYFTLILHLVVCSWNILFDEDIATTLLSVAGNSDEHIIGIITDVGKLLKRLKSSDPSVQTPKEDEILEIMKQFASNFEVQSNYLHLISCHAVEQINRHSNLINFSAEFCKSINHRIKLVYRGNSNKKKNMYLNQIMKNFFVKFVLQMTFLPLTTDPKTHNRKRIVSKENKKIATS